MTTENKSAGKGCWQSVPVMIGSGAALITAIAGLLTAIHALSRSDGDDKSQTNTQIPGTVTGSDSSNVEDAKLKAELARILAGLKDNNSGVDIPEPNLVDVSGL